MATPDEIRSILEACRRQRDPSLLQEARAAFRQARGQQPDDDAWRAVAQYGKQVASLIEDPASLPWTATSDGLGLLAHIDDEDYLVVHPHAGAWRAGAAWPQGEQPTFWSPERHPSREAAMAAAGAVTIPTAYTEATT